MASATMASAAFLFQSTLSVRRATNRLHPPFDVKRISIHALRKESDPRALFSSSNVLNFNPRSP